MMNAARTAAGGAARLVGGAAQFALHAAKVVMRSTILSAAAVGAGIWYLTHDKDDDQQQEQARDATQDIEAREWDAPQIDIGHAPEQQQSHDHLQEVNDQQQYRADVASQSRLDDLRGAQMPDRSYGGIER